jgi:hypothetical protein
MFINDINSIIEDVLEIPLLEHLTVFGTAELADVEVFHLLSEVFNAFVLF